MLTRRIIPCLDIKNDRVVKGVQFESLVDQGDPVERAVHYTKNGADELCFLDVASTIEHKSISKSLIETISRSINIPFTVGGGIRSVEDAREVLRSGADKVAVNSAALASPKLLSELASAFGSQCVVVSIDTRKNKDGWYVTTHGGSRFVSSSCLDWAREAKERGAGEILLNVIDTDGMRDGFELEITGAVNQAVTVPVIASGGGGCPDHFVQVFQKTGVSAALAASMFHDNSYTPRTLKEVLANDNIEVRL